MITTDTEDRAFDTPVETGRRESSTRLERTFADEDRGEEAVFVYEGSPPDMAREGLQTIRTLFEGSMDAAKSRRTMPGG